MSDPWVDNMGGPTPGLKALQRIADALEKQTSPKVIVVHLPEGTQITMEGAQELVDQLRDAIMNVKL